jgi:uncharacterized RDD family membrane protein YckC
MSRAIRNARARAMQGQRAGIVTRLLAIGIDLAIVFLLYTGVLWAYAIIGYLVSSKPLALPTPDNWVRIVLAGGVAFVYLVTSWVSTGRTVGSQVFGICVLTEQGMLPKPGRAMARALICLTIGWISMAWVLVSRKNAAIHDLVCRTAVVYDWRGHALAVADAADG